MWQFIAEEDLEVASVFAHEREVFSRDGMPHEAGATEAGGPGQIRAEDQVTEVAMEDHKGQGSF